MAAIFVLSALQGARVASLLLKLHGSLLPVVTGLRQVRLPMTGSAVGGVRLWMVAMERRRGGGGWLYILLFCHCLSSIYI